MNKYFKTVITVLFFFVSSCYSMGWLPLGLSPHNYGDMKRYSADNLGSYYALSLKNKLIDALADDFEQVELVIKQKEVDLNAKTSTKLPELTVFGHAISNFLTLTYNHEYLLKVIKYLLQHGAQAEVICVYTSSKNFTPLQKVLKSSVHNVEFYIKLIELLLDYGAIIDERVLKYADTKFNYAKDLAENIRDVLSNHQKLRDKALNSPKKKLLEKALREDEPAIVELIMKNGWSLVTKDSLDLALKFSPNSVKFIKSVFKLSVEERWKKLASMSTIEEQIPIELLDHIKKIIDHNVQEIVDKKE